MIIRAINNLPINAPKTYLSNPEVAGTNILRWKNPAGFNASWAIQVGETGEEQTEVVLLGSSTPAGTAGTLTANTLYEHPADTPIYAIKYDQIVFEVSSAGTAGTAAPLTNGTVTLQSDSLYSQFDDTTGSVSYAYKTYFRNSVLSVTTTESDWITPAGFSFYSLAKMRTRVQNKLVSAGYIKDDTIINDWINEWLEVMTNTVIDVNEDYAIGTTSVAFANNIELGTITAADYKQNRRVWWVDGTGTYTMTKMEETSFLPTQTFNSTVPFFYMQGDNIIGRKPTDTAGTMQINYYKLNTYLASDTDELPSPMRGYTKSFVDYAMAQALMKDSKTQEATAKESLAFSALGRFKAEMAPRSKTGPTYADIVEDVGGDNNYWF